MNHEALHDKLISVARSAAPDDRVPYAFEKRVTALIRGRAAAQSLDKWVRGLWRAALSCVVVAAIFGGWAFLTPASSGSTSEDLSQNFETTLLAGIDQGDATP